MKDKKMHKLTVDDLICEYLLYKINNGYEPSFTACEFSEFLLCFEMNMDIEEGFFENNNIFKSFHSGDKSIINHPTPFIDVIYNRELGQYVVKANYKFNDYYESTLSTYYLKNNSQTTNDIKNIMGVFLSNSTKRVINGNTNVNESELLVGKYIARMMVMNIWNAYLDKYTLYNSMRKNPFRKNDGDIISIENMQNDLLELYGVLSKRVAIMYHNDRNLQIDTYHCNYLARANYDLLINGYEKLVNMAYGSYKKSLKIDFSNLTFNEYYILDGRYENNDSYNEEIILQNREKNLVMNLSTQNKR